MRSRERYLYAAKAATLHFGVSLLVGLVAAWLVYRVWYPDGLHRLTGGAALFFLLMAVDVVCGPVLTLVLYSPVKSKLKWRVDMGLIALVQVTALVYGLIHVAAARPVFLAFEGDRFRVVQAFDVDKRHLQEAQAPFTTLPWNGPKPIGIHLSTPNDTDYLGSVQMSLLGLHPAFRPSRWRSYSDQRPRILELLRPLSQLESKNADRLNELHVVIRKFGITPEQMGYLPLVNDLVTDWVIVIDRSTALPLGCIPFDGW